MSHKLAFVAGAGGAAIVGCQIALLPGPFDRSLPSHLLQLAVILLATLSAAGCALRSRDFSRRFWLLITLGFVLLAAAQALRTYERFWAPPTYFDTLGIRDFFFVFYMVPFLLALFLHEDHHDNIKSGNCLDVLQVVAICFMLFNALLYSRSIAAGNLAAPHIIRLFSFVLVVRNLGLTAAFWLRVAVSRGNERSALRTMAIYLSVYTAGSLLGQWVYSTVHPTPHWIELEGTVPFAVAVVLFGNWRMQPTAAQEQPGAFRRILSQHLLPSLLPVLVVMTGIGLWRSHPISTSVVIGVSSFLFALRLVVTSYAEHHAARAAIREITERQRAEEELRRSESRFRAFFGTEAVGAAETGLDGRFLEVNQRYCQLTGYSREELLGMGPADLTHPDDRDRDSKQLAAYERGDLPTYETEKRYVRQDGGVIWVQVTAAMIRDAEGQLLRSAGIIQDITERKRVEEALLRSEKLASVGRMAASIAHEINNPLSAVTNLLYLVKEMNDLPESARYHLEIADEELKRVAHITRQSLGFYRESNAPELTSVNGVLESAIDLMMSKIKTKQAKIDRQWREDVQIIAVAGELRQVFSNLLANSLDAIDARGTIKLRVSAGTAPSNGYRRVRVTIADNGKGIPANLQQHLFEPFFTTKGTIGTGLGLWVSKQILDKHQGTIQVRSNTDGARRGTVFSIVLPVEPAMAATSQSAGA